MKIVNKYILASCVFCYFGGLYIAASKMGIMRLVSRYGLSRSFSEWPEDFPSLNLIIVCLAVYTVLFIIVAWWLMKFTIRHGEEMDQLQQKASTLHNYSEQVSMIVSRYGRICRDKNVDSKQSSQRMQLLQRHVASLPASVLANGDAASVLSRTVSHIGDAVSAMENATESAVGDAHQKLLLQVEDAIDTVQRLKTGAISIKN